MNNHFRLGGITLLFVGAIGCGTSEAPNGDAVGSQASLETAQMAKATLHINGFKKSKSGAT
jgi:hypothetical protein